MKPTAPPIELDVYPLRLGTDNVVAGIPVMLSNTVNNEPPTQVHQVAEYSSWTTGICDCFSDMNSCCCVFWCPCIAFGRIANIVDKGTSSCCACGSLYLFLTTAELACFTIATLFIGNTFTAPTSFGWILSCIYRGKLKQNLNMRPSCLEDCCCHFWCEPCALCQEYRELQNRGYDLSLGWEGNMKKQNVALSNSQDVLPPTAPTMNR